MSTDLIIYIDPGHTDDHLTIKDTFVPLYLAEKLSALKDIDRLFFSIPEQYEGKLSSDERSKIRRQEDTVAFWKQCAQELESTHLIRIYGDSYFLDPVVITEMMEVHTKYVAEFTFSENLPSGLGCEIFSQSLINQLPETDEKTLPLSKVIKSNINQFDVELYYKDPDIRDKRILFHTSNLRDRQIMANIVESHGSVPEYEQIKDIIEKNPELLYIGPSYIEVELTGACNLDCIYCYRTTLDQEHPEISLDMYEKILTGMREFNLPYTICFGGSGEPLMHSKFFEILEKTVADPLVEQVILETNGCNADISLSQALMKEEYSKVKVIVNINGLDKNTYNTLHNQDTFDKVLENLELLQKLNENEDRLYVQIMKINETEEYLDRFYDLFESKNLPIILQKQNTFLGRIEDRRYSDLSPLVRSNCWHLQRDLLILSDGRLGLCKQDVAGEWSPGSLSESTLAELWEKRKTQFLTDYSGTRLKTPDCKSCDEWYTFNF